MSLDFTLCHLKDKHCSLVNPPLDTKNRGAVKLVYKPVCCKLRLPILKLVNLSPAVTIAIKVQFAAELQGCTTR